MTENAHLIINKWVNNPCTNIIISPVHGFLELSPPLKKTENITVHDYYNQLIFNKSIVSY